MPYHRTPRIALLALFATVAALPAQDNGKSRGFVLEAGEHQIGDIIERAARFLGRNLILEPTEIGRGVPAITLQKSLNLDVHGCEEVVSQLAFMKGLVMSPVDEERGIFEFINVNGPRRAAIRSVLKKPEELQRRPNLVIKVTTVIYLEHVDAKVVTQNLRPFVHNNGRYPAVLVGNVGTPNAIMLQGIVGDVLETVATIRRMDVPATGSVPTNDLVARI